MKLVLQHYDIASKPAISNSILSLGFDTCLGVSDSHCEQGSTLRPVGLPMRLDLVRWRLTFLVWSPVWPPRFQVIILFLFIFSFPKIHDEMNEC